jgi:ribosomal protein S15P/S13E
MTAIDIAPVSTRSRKLRGNARLIQRAIEEEAKTGVAKEDIAFLRPADRNKRLREHLKHLKIVVDDDTPSDRAFRTFFNGR